MSEFNGKGNFKRGHHGKGGGRQQHGKGKGKGQHNGKGRKAGVNGRGGGNRRRQDINAKNLGDRNRANRDAGSGGGQGAGHRGARAESSPWEPDQGRQLQRRDIVLSASEQYTLFFPLELTNKDYLRRIFETVAQGIKDRTVQISEDNQLRRFYENDFDGDCSHDMYYLVKQLIAPTSNDFSEVDQLLHRRTFETDLNCSIGTLIQAAEHLRGARNALAHMSSDTPRLTNLEAAFQAAKELLSCFGSSGAFALTRLMALEQQFHDHREFKEARMDAFEWSWAADDRGAAAEEATEGDVGTAVESLEDKTADVKVRLEAALQEREVAHTKLVCRLGDLKGVVRYHENLAAKAENFEEADRLNKLAEDLDNTVRDDGPAAHGAVPADFAISGGGFGQDRVYFMKVAFFLFLPLSLFLRRRLCISVDYWF